MEISIRLILVAAVGLIALSIVVFIVSDRVGGFDNILGNQQDDAECQLLQEQLDRAEDNGDDGRADEIREDACDRCSGISCPFSPPSGSPGPPGAGIL